jgi:hypothetical protein
MSQIYALAEALRQFDEALQHLACEAVLKRMSRETLQALAALPPHMPTRRTRYAVAELLKRGEAAESYGSMPVLTALVPIFNHWCAEGRRRPIALVLRELDDAELDALGQIDTLMEEVASMTREFHG